jgi:hypothetical protein
MAKGSKNYEGQADGGYTKAEYAAEGKPVTMHGGRGEMADGKVSMGTKYPNRNGVKGNGRTE